MIASGVWVYGRLTRSLLGLNGHSLRRRAANSYYETRSKEYDTRVVATVAGSWQPRSRDSDFLHGARRGLAQRPDSLHIEPCNEAWPGKPAPAIWIQYAGWARPRIHTKGFLTFEEGGVETWAYLVLNPAEWG